jgi:hypothetical protein
MSRKTLTTFDEVLRELGGLSEAARTLNTTPQCVWNWRNRGFFPATKADDVRKLLRRRNCNVAPEVVRQENNVDAA